MPSESRLVFDWSNVMGIEPIVVSMDRAAAAPRRLPRVGSSEACAVMLPFSVAA
jgi:hypothetical protein